MSPFQQLRQLAERCLAELGGIELNPRHLWFHDDAEELETVKRTLSQLVGSLQSGLASLETVQDPRFAAVKSLEDWLAFENELPDWRGQIEILRPAADAEHVKVRLISIRTRISELIDGLAVRAAVRDPRSRFANSLQAEKSIDGLLAERGLRELGLGLLGVTWKETLGGSVADWSIEFGPQHRIELLQFCQKLLIYVRGIKASAGGVPALASIIETGDGVGDRLQNIYGRLIEFPVDRVDAGISSDFHYLASLAKKIVNVVSESHATIVREFSGKDIPPAVGSLFHLLHLTVPKRRARRAPTMSTQELEREIGQRLWDPTSS